MTGILNSRNKYAAAVFLLILLLCTNGSNLFAGIEQGGPAGASLWCYDRPFGLADMSVMNDIVISKAETGIKEKTGISNLVPRQNEEVPLWKALAVDLGVPGGGALYHRNYYWGAAFGIMKIAGAWAVYHYYRVWEYRRSLYYSARDANASLDPNHELQFRVPGEGYKTVGELRRDYDRAAQNITFSVIANVLVYTVSLFTTYYFVERINENSIPAFELAVDRKDSEELTEYMLRCSFSYRM